MPRVHVCSLARIEAEVARTGARSLVTLLSPGTAVTRPAEIAHERHLNIAMSDILDHLPGQVRPERHHLDAFVDFVESWDRREPMLIHCFAGVSRSTASAYIAVCQLSPHRDEAEIAQALRAASPTATPNLRFVALADERLQRGGRMVAAIEGIGRGEECLEGVPFALEL
ncbi:MAG: dual specificity protein phosphatase family protein [Pseudomonadota bacterium]|nr:dual specificity protein phosphatase family protein [Pseudomonadota bacterium]